MRRIIALLILIAATGCFADTRNQYKNTLSEIGYKTVDEIDSLHRPQNEHQLISPLDITSVGDLSFLTAGENGLSRGGMTGLMDIPSAFIISKNYCNTGIHYLNARGSFTTVQGIYDSRKNSYSTYCNYGINDGMELGVNHMEINSTINNLFDDGDYTTKFSFNTFNIKLAVPYKGAAVALGGQYTPITDKDQLLLDFMDAEHLNNFYLAISTRLTQKMYGHLLGKSSFIRGSNTTAFNSDKTSFLTSGLGIEYKHNRNMSIFSEVKKLYGDYIQNDADTVINFGTRYNNNKFGVDLGFINIANDSSSIYSYGFNYTF